MDIQIRMMQRGDTDAVIDMMRVFYASPAVMSNGSEEIFRADVEACLSDSPYLEGYVFDMEGQVEGYAMLAKSFSTEFGRPCIWVEDIYLREALRGSGIGTRFFAFIEEKYPGVVFRLEAEEDNEAAVHVYRKVGYKELPYLEMIKK